MNENYVKSTGQFKGEYTVEISGPSGKTETRFANLIVQGGRDLFAENTVSELLFRCGVGVGNLPVSDEQSKLAAPVGKYVSCNSMVVDSPRSFTDRITATFIFIEGSFDGVDLAEVGVFNRDLKLFSRALFKNPQGHLEPITVEKNQRVVITYKLEISRPEAPVNLQLQIPDAGGVLRSHSVRIFPQDVPRYKNMGSTVAEFSPAPDSLNTCTANAIHDEYNGVVGSAASNNTVDLGIGSVLPQEYFAGSRIRKVAIKVESNQCNNRPITGFELVHPEIGTVMTATVEPGLEKDEDYRLFFDTELSW